MLRTITLAFFLSALPPALVAQSFYERELQQLTEQHDKALAAAAAPINRNYQAALEQLLVRTTRNKDLDTSTKVVAALRAIGAPAVVPGTPATPDVPPAAIAMAKGQLEELLVSKTWVHLGQFHYKFTKDGRISLVEDKRKGRFQIDEKAGFVSFTWDNGLYPGEGIKLNLDAASFTHSGGGPFVAAK